MNTSRVLVVVAALLFASGVSAQVTLAGSLTGSPTSAPLGTMNFGTQPVGATGPAQTETVTAHLFAIPPPLPPGSVAQIKSVSSNTGEFQVTGGSCLGASVLVPDGGNCTVDLAFKPAAVGTRTGVLSVQCAVVAAIGVVAFVCDDAVHQFMLMSGLGAATVQAAIPTLSREAITALALLVMLASFYYLRRR